MQTSPSLEIWDFHTHQKGECALYSCDLLARDVPALVDCPYVSAGLHPWSLPQDFPSPLVEQALCRLENLAREGRIVAVGEVGWDAHSPAIIAHQQQIVETQWQISEQYRLPMILHVVKRWQELERFVRYLHPTVPLIVHGFRGKAPLAQSLLRLGVWLSFGQYYNLESLRVAWMEGLLLLETDDSSLPIRSIYDAVARDLEIDFALLQERLTTLAPQLFRGV